MNTNDLFDLLKAAGDAVQQHNLEFPHDKGGKFIYSMGINEVENTGAHMHIQWDWFRELWIENKCPVRANLCDGSFYHVYLKHRGVTCTSIAREKELKDLLKNPLPKGSWSIWGLMDLFREECKADGWDPIADDFGDGEDN